MKEYANIDTILDLFENVVSKNVKNNKYNSYSKDKEFLEFLNFKELN